MKFVKIVMIHWQIWALGLTRPRIIQNLGSTKKKGSWEVPKSVVKPKLDKINKKKEAKKISKITTRDFIGKSSNKHAYLW